MASALCCNLQGYIFFSEHKLVSAFQRPPAFSQSAWFFAVLTSPANAGPVTASASANASDETSVFIAFTPYVGGSAEKTPPGL
jgi:hypothetical protein